MKRRIIAFILTLTTLVSLFAVYASAASGEEYISEVSLVYKDTLEEAEAAIAGTDWKLYEKDLNPKADYWFDDGVYLIYKTTTDVEEAITDLRVMDMYGGYSISDYQTQLEESRAEYKALIVHIRNAAEEFKSAYKAGDAMALLAYRQMNYYKDVKTEGGTETDMLMGDFFLNLPTDEKIIQVMMEGNTNVVNNLFSLLAVGISGADDTTLAAKVAEQYAIKDTLTDEVYDKDATVLANKLLTMRAKILRYDALIEEYDLDSEDELTDEQFQLLTEYGSVALLLEGIKLGETNLADLIRGGSFTARDLYPIVAALTEGQKALVAMGQIETILKYNSPSDTIENLNATLDTFESNYADKDGSFKTINVYIGVDRSIFKGKFAMTTAAERQQAKTGETWGIGSAAYDSIQMYVIAGMFSILEGVFIATYVKTQANVAALGAYAAKAAEIASSLGKTSMVVSNAENAYAAAQADWALSSPILKGACVGVALIIVGLIGISTWYNYYNPDYTAIPNTMVDVRETDLGDKYIKYTAAKVYRDQWGKNADFNAYEGKEWIALYYTKDATAGKCLTPKFVYSDNNSSIARRHQGISMFGESEAFDLNTHAYDKNAPAVYVTMRYSTAKKAAADIPEVVGSMFSDGAIYALTALGGAAVGVGAMFAIGALKKKKEEPEEAES